MPSTIIREQILEANAAFYAAFRERDPEAVMRLWADGPGITCIPGIGLPAFTRDDVERGFQEALRPRPDFALTFEVLDVAFTDPVATVTCAERIEGGGQVFDFLATNLWVMDGTGWRLAHHHASWRATEFSEAPPGVTGAVPR